MYYIDIQFLGCSNDIRNIQKIISELNKKRYAHRTSKGTPFGNAKNY